MTPRRRGILKFALKPDGHCPRTQSRPALHATATLPDDKAHNPHLNAYTRSTPAAQLSKRHAHRSHVTLQEHDGASRAYSQDSVHRTEGVAPQATPPGALQAGWVS